MAWSDNARALSLATRQANAKTGDKGAHALGVAKVGAPILNDKVFDVVKNTPPGGGFSVSPDGKVPTKGYMVAVPGHSQVLDADATSGPNGKSIIHDYAAQHADALKEPGAHIGGWHSDEGKLFLDVSKNISNQRAAVKAGKDANQIAIWDVKRKREIRTGGTGE